MTADREPRDPALDAMWRAHSNEAPPAHLDQAILAAAHRAAGSVPHSAGSSAAATRPWQWWMPLAAAATIGVIAIGVLQVVPDAALTPTTTSDIPDASDMPPAKPASVDRPTAAAEPIARPMQSEAERSAPASAPPASPSAPAAAAPKSKPATPSRESAPRAREPSKRENTASAPDPFPAHKALTPPEGPSVEAPAAALAPPPRSAPSLAAGAPMARAPESRQSADLERDSRVAARRDAAASPPRAEMQQPTAASQQLGKLAMSDDARAPRDPAAWIARIRAQLAAGNKDEAARELAAFRAAYRDADARLPEDLRAWALAIKP